MTDYRQIYDTKADAYERMVSAEDCEGHLAAALSSLTTEGVVGVDVGCGTGRISRLLVEAGARRVIGVEPAPAMLEVARRQLAGHPVDLRLGDALELPVEDGVAGLVVAGWVFGHFTSWYAASWRARLKTALDEFDRVSGEGAVQIVIETLGTGTDGPAPPTLRLAEYNDCLEREHGFRKQVVQTDYLFPSPEVAADSVRFFFGDAVADALLHERRCRVPEWTGVWSRPI